MDSHIFPTLMPSAPPLRELFVQGRTYISNKQSKNDEEEGTDIDLHVENIMNEALV